MKRYYNIANRFQSAFGLNFSIVGHNYINSKPDNSVAFKEGNGGCITSLIFSAAKGKTVAVDKDTAGWNCAAYYMGYRDSIFPGIEFFLSCGPKELVGRDPEKFCPNPEIGKQWVDSFKPKILEERIGIFKPLELFNKEDCPETVTIFANADQISGLVYLAHFKTPLVYDKVITGTMSSCMAMINLPLRFARSGIDKIVWGHNDPSARLRLPKDLMTLSMPITTLEDMNNDLDESFVNTHLWNEVLKRNAKQD